MILIVFFTSLLTHLACGTHAPSATSNVLLLKKTSSLPRNKHPRPFPLQIQSPSDLRQLRNFFQMRPQSPQGPPRPALLVQPTLQSHAYEGSLYDPSQDRIYWLPYGQSNASHWHVVNLRKQTIETYPVGLSLPNYAYRGGVISPQENRIYLAPHHVSGGNTITWIDLTNQRVHRQSTSTNYGGYAYIGGSYVAHQNRIYFAPFGQTPQNTWHYWDVEKQDLIGYASGAPSSGTYAGSVYSPTQKRIYLVPFSASSSTQWYYIDCQVDPPQVVSYDHPNVSIGVHGFWGGVWVPEADRIYFMPYSNTGGAYIDCATGQAHSYPMPPVGGAARGGTYFPPLQAIVLSAFSQIGHFQWLNWKTHIWEALPLPQVATDLAQLSGASWDPLHNRVWFAPHSAGTSFLPRLDLPGGHAFPRQIAALLSELKGM